MPEGVAVAVESINPNSVQWSFSRVKSEVVGVFSCQVPSLKIPTHGPALRDEIPSPSEPETPNETATSPLVTDFQMELL